MATRCADCKYATGEIHYQEHQCRRHAPTVQMLVSTSKYESGSTTWPLVRSGDWCGDFEERPLTVKVDA